MWAKKVQKMSAGHSTRAQTQRKAKPKCLTSKPGAQEAAMLNFSNTAWWPDNRHTCPVFYLISVHANFQNMTVFGENKLGWVQWGFLLVRKSLFLSSYRGRCYFLLGDQRGEMQMGQRKTECWEASFFLQAASCNFILYLHSHVWGQKKNLIFFKKKTQKMWYIQIEHFCTKRTLSRKWASCYSTNLSRRGQQVDGGQKHPTTTRLLTLVHLQELDYGSTGCLCKENHAHTTHINTYS